MIIVLTGATGTGKSQMAVSLAQKIGGEVVNGDAFQVYQELNIATAKPSLSLRSIVPHHLFDFVPLTKDYDVATYQSDLRAALQDILSRGKTPIIAGGTGLYIRAGLYDYSFPAATHADMGAYRKLSDEELYAKLQQVDPKQAQIIHPHNRIRVLRALEIYVATGHPKSFYLANQSQKPLFDAAFFALHKEREDLYPELDERIEEMFAAGLVEEDRRLIEKYGRAPHAFQAIGVKELFPYFDGQKSLEAAKDQIKLNTHHYVKRQETFFNHQFPIVYVNSLDDLLGRIEHGDR